MPRNPNLQQRIDWHIAHTAECGCREVPDTVKLALEERGEALPKKRG